MKSMRESRIKMLDMQQSLSRSQVQQQKIQSKQLILQQNQQFKKQTEPEVL